MTYARLRSRHSPLVIIVGPFADPAEVAALAHPDVSQEGVDPREVAGALPMVDYVVEVLG